MKTLNIQDSQIGEALETLGNQLREERIRRQDRQADLAVRIGVSLSTLRSMEAGDPGVSIANWMKAWSFVGGLDVVANAIKNSQPEDMFADIEREIARGDNKPRRVRKNA